MLNGTLEQNGCSKGKDIACAARGAMLIVGTIALVESRTAEVHRTDSVADKRMQASVERLIVARTLTKMQVF